MKLLLDTHILLWWLNNNPELSEKFRQLISDPENTVFVSAVSLWEIWIKQSVGKLRLPANFQELLELQEFQNLALTVRQTAAVADLPWHHRDPFDRMLVVQAQAERLKLLTANAAMAAYGDVVVTGK